METKGNLRAFNAEVRRIFQKAMDEASDAGQARNLSVEEICVSIAVATIHCTAMAIVGGRLPVEHFTGLLPKDVDETRARLATGRLSHLRRTQ